MKTSYKVLVGSLSFTPFKLNGISFWHWVSVHSSLEPKINRMPSDHIWHTRKLYSKHLIHASYTFVSFLINVYCVCYWPRHYVFIQLSGIMFMFPSLYTAGIVIMQCTSNGKCTLILFFVGSICPMNPTGKIDQIWSQLLISVLCIHRKSK